MNDFVELRRVLAIALRRWWLLIALAAIGAAVGYGISRGQTPVYQATTTVLVGESIRSARVDRVDIQISEALIQTYVEIARRQPVLQGVVTTLNLNQSWQQLKNHVTVTPIESTQLIEITVEASSPELAQTIADEVVNQLILLSPSSSESADNQLTNSFNREQIAKLQQRIVEGQQRLAEIETAINNSVSEIELASLQQEKANLEGLLIEWERNYTQLLTLTEPKRDPTQLTVVEPAHSNNRMVRPRTRLNTMLGGLLGLILGFALVILWDFLDDTYRTLKDFSQSEEVNILGSVRRIKGKRLSDKIIAHLQPHSPITESYRIIRSRIRFKRADHPARSLMVTSSMPEEGKSLTVANLAVVFAQANIKTIIVDADLRHPVLHKVFDVENTVGLGDILSSRDLRVEEHLKKTPVDNLLILTSGKALPDPSGSLGSERMEEIVMELRQAAEVILFDSPPVLVFADAIALSRRMDGIIMVIRAGKSTRSAINQALLDLQSADANVLGSIFNQAPKSDSFSVNRIYLQEQPLLPFARFLTRRESRFRGLRDVAVPLKERPALSPESESAGEPARQAPGDLFVAGFEEPRVVVSDNGRKETDSGLLQENKSATSSNNHKKASLLHDLSAPELATQDAFQSPEPADAEADIDEVKAETAEEQVFVASREDDLESSDSIEQEAGMEADQFKMDDRALSANDLPEASNPEEKAEDLDNVPVEAVAEPDEPGYEIVQVPDSEAEHLDPDEADLHEEGEMAVSMDVNPSLSQPDPGNGAGEAGEQQRKGRKRRRSKHKDLKGEEILAGSTADPAEGSAE